MQSMETMDLIEWNGYNSNGSFIEKWNNETYMIIGTEGISMPNMVKRVIFS